MSYIVVVFLSILNAGHAYAYDSLFIVENVKVDVTAENSVKAQAQALEQAQAQAFQVLAKRMVDEVQVQNVSTPDSLTISSLLKDYEITEESISPVRYIGTYTFRFREAAVSKFFSISGVSFTDKRSKPLLVLPIFQKNGRNILWSKGNSWMQAWSIARLSGGLVPVEVPIGDLMDMSDIDEDQALRYERKKLDRMLARYDAKEAAIIIAIPDNILLGITSSQLPAKGVLRISIYRTDRMNAQHVRDIIMEPESNETLEDFYNRAVLKSYAALQKDWKSKTAASAAQSRIFLVNVALRDINQWVKIKGELGNVAGVSDIFLVSMKKTAARLSFKFRGDEAHLRDALSRYNLYLGQARINGSKHKFTTHKRSDPDVIYDLAYGSKNNISGIHTF